MKSSFLKISLALALIFISPMVSHGADEATGATDTTATTTETPLILESITVQDDMHVLVSFNQTIVTEAVRVRVSKQSDGSSLKIDKVTSVVDTPKSVLVALSDVLEEGGTYSMTVMSAISEGGVVIKEGADAIKEFTATAPLKKSLVVFNAPSNPNAAIAATGGSTSVPTQAASTGTTAVSATATELPLTGMNPLLLIILA